ncbi:mucin-like protein [Dreissena polymorpha]|uniref:mucin-like protein n=1 Tax=Dreissena polymorpha TaxID=45954 RepID=UPI0022641BB5|nr:mucin-like protein [Dreissena polymorpha]
MRTRTCTNPPPLSHGKNCEGPKTDYKSCVRDACLIDGSWGAWNLWGSCSATCRVGIQHRNRFCDNPPPARFGDHCFGDSLDDRICMNQGCSDGGWATWSSWSSCTATCDGGTSQRYRECTNPTPSPYGQQCHGPNTNFKVCSIFPCLQTATTPNILFKVRRVKNETPSDGEIIVFEDVLYNNGSGYNSSIGILTAPVGGTYLFTARLLSQRGGPVFFEINVNGNMNSNGALFAHQGYSYATADSVVRLLPGDRVFIKSLYSNSISNSGLSSYLNYNSNEFTGWMAMSNK